MRHSFRSITMLFRAALGSLLLAACLTCLAHGADPSATIAATSTDEALARIEELGGIVRQVSRESDALEVDLRYCRSPVDDAQLQHVVGLKDVVVLRLGGSAVSDAGLAHVAKLTSLRHLALVQSAVSDAGVAQLAALVELETLNLFGTRVSDDSLTLFLKLPKLRRVFLAGTQVTDEAIARLQKERPSLVISPNRGEERRRAKIAVEMTTATIADAEESLKTAEQDLQQLAPQEQSLKKASEEANKTAEDEKRKADSFRGRDWQEANKLVERLKREEDEAKRRLDTQADDEKIRQQLEEKQKAYAEAQRKRDEAQQQLNTLQAAAEAARERSTAARKLYDRSRNAKKNVENMQQTLDSAKLQKKYAENRVQSFE